VLLGHRWVGGSGAGAGAREAPAAAAASAAAATASSAASAVHRCCCAGGVGHSGGETQAAGVAGRRVSLSMHVNRLPRGYG